MQRVELAATTDRVTRAAGRQERGSHRPATDDGLQRTLSSLLVATVFVSVAIPKAGVKLGELPVTLGNVLFGVTLIVSLFAFVSGRRIPDLPFTRGVLLVCGYFAVRLTASALFGEVAIDAITAFVISPLIAVALVASVRSPGSLARLHSALSIGFWIVIGYAILQMILGAQAVAVPGLTVNYSDFRESATWFLDKNNAVGDSVKLFSTYQNGNLLGVNLLLIFPIVYERMRTSLKPIALVLFLGVEFFTLSRSVWLGTVIYVLVAFLFKRAKSLPDFLLKMTVSSALIVAIPVMFVFSPQLAERLGQARGGELWQAAGRTPALLDLVSSTVGNGLAFVFGPVGITSFEGDAFEITMGAVYKYSGLVGVALLTLVVSRAFISIGRGSDGLPRASRSAILVYALTSLVEGAFLLPPTAIIFWTVVGIGVASSRMPRPAPADDDEVHTQGILGDQCGSASSRRVHLRP